MLMALWRRAGTQWPEHLKLKKQEHDVGNKTNALKVLLNTSKNDQTIHHTLFFSEDTTISTSTSVPTRYSFNSMSMGNTPKVLHIRTERTPKHNVTSGIFYMAPR